MTYRTKMETHHLQFHKEKIDQDLLGSAHLLQGKTQTIKWRGPPVIEVVAIFKMLKNVAQWSHHYSSRNQIWHGVKFTHSFWGNNRFTRHLAPPIWWKLNSGQVAPPLLPMLRVLIAPILPIQHSRKEKTLPLNPFSLASSCRHVAFLYSKDYSMSEYGDTIAAWPAAPLLLFHIHVTHIQISPCPPSVSDVIYGRSLTEYKIIFKNFSYRSSLNFPPL